MDFEVDPELSRSPGSGMLGPTKYFGPDAGSWPRGARCRNFLLITGVVLLIIIMSIMAAQFVVSQRAFLHYLLFHNPETQGFTADTHLMHEYCSKAMYFKSCYGAVDMVGTLLRLPDAQAIQESIRNMNDSRVFSMNGNLDVNGDPYLEQNVIAEADKTQNNAFFYTYRTHMYGIGWSLGFWKTDASAEPSMRLTFCDQSHQAERVCASLDVMQ